MTQQSDYIFKYIITGDAGCGKTCLLTQFTEERFIDTSPTMGVEIAFRDITIDDHCIRLQIWDTAGQERFKSLTVRYYRESTVALLVFDIHRRKSFLSIVDWLSDVRKYTGTNTRCILIGNKCDIDTHRAVSYEEANAFAQSNDLIYAETSAKTGYNVVPLFIDAAKSVFQLIQGGIINPDDKENGINIVSEHTLVETTNKCCSYI
jgi:small GTP-binding protein